MNYRILSTPLILLALCITAQAEPLKVKPGIWETTTTTETKRANKPTNLDKLTPEQRAMVEITLENKVKKETKTVQACLSEAQIKSGENFLGKNHQANCKRTFQYPLDPQIEIAKEVAPESKHLRELHGFGHDLRLIREFPQFSLLHSI